MLAGGLLSLLPPQCRYTGTGMLCLTLTTFLMASGTSPGQVTKDNAATYLAGTRVWVCGVCVRQLTMDSVCCVFLFMQQIAQQQQQQQWWWQWQRQVLWWWCAGAAHACIANLWVVADACRLCAWVAPTAALDQSLVCVHGWNFLLCVLCVLYRCSIPS